MKLVKAIRRFERRIGVPFATLAKIKNGRWVSPLTAFRAARSIGLSVEESTQAKNEYEIGRSNWEKMGEKKSE